MIESEPQLLQAPEAEPIDMESLGKRWIDRIQQAEHKAETYNARCENVEKLFGKLEALADNAGDREFQMFWANIQVLLPIVYTRPPQPVVMPRYRERDEVKRKASEILERVLESDVEMDDLHDTLKMARDDMVLCSRGVTWVLDNAQCIHVDRVDFLHEPARNWREVTWVARRAYLSMEQGLERFGDVFLTATLDEREGEENDEYDHPRKASVWEIWDKESQQVIWVTEGVKEALDVQPPMVNVKGFFPCPRPAYGTVERRTLTPIPDVAFYRDQLDEINELTDRIAALSESLRVKGFYASGNADVSDAIETAMRHTDNKAILVPVAALSAFGSNAVKDSIVWLPIVEVATVIKELVALRQQLIQDVYEITGLSDIMRGATNAQETAKAQTLKAQYGSIRVRERQGEMVRLARDVFRIKAEIFTEQYPIQHLLFMSQVQDIPTQQQAMMQAQQAAQQGQQVPPNPVTIEAIDQLFKSEKSRPFALDVESDSTIQPDEEAEKKSRMEFLQAIGGFFREAGPVVAQRPEMAPFMADLLKFTAGGFRAGRELGSSIDDLAMQMKQLPQQEQGPSPEEIEAKAKAQREQQKGQIEQAELQLKAQDMAQKNQRENVKLQFEMAKAAQELGLKVDEARLKELQAEVDAMLRVEEMEMEREQNRPVAFGD